MRICGFQKLTTVDFPGILAAAVFSPGCNFDCYYCHNRALLSDSLPLIETQEVLNYLTQRRNLLDGVVVTGGEPTLQPDLLSFLQELKKMGYRVKLDTNGSRPDVVGNAIRENLVDYIALDYKAPFAKFKSICGDGADPVSFRATLDLLLQGHVPYELRTTVIPELSLADLQEMAGAIPAVPHFILQRYRLPEVFEEAFRDRLFMKNHSEAELSNMSMALLDQQPGAIFR